jgi:hypothetical protein
MPKRRPPEEPSAAEWEAAERRRSTFEQWVEADYEIADGLVRRAEDPEENGRGYFPMAIPALVGEFVRLRIGDTNALSAFVHRWGLLGYDDLSQRDGIPFESWALGDPLAWVWAHLSGVHTALSLWKFWREQDEAGLIQYIDRRKASEARWDVLEPVTLLLAKKRFVDAQQMIEGHFAAPGRRPDEAADGILNITGDGRSIVVALEYPPSTTAQSWDVAWHMIRRSINPNLRGVHAQISSHVERYPDRTIVVQGWDALISVVYRHIFETMASGEVEECRECQTPFIRTDGRQRFCPPVPPARESNCAMRFHKREQRKRARVTEPSK